MCAKSGLGCSHQSPDITTTCATTTTCWLTPNASTCYCVLSLTRSPARLSVSPTASPPSRPASLARAMPPWRPLGRGRHPRPGPLGRGPGPRTQPPWLRPCWLAGPRGPPGMRCPGAPCPRRRRPTRVADCVEVFLCPFRWYATLDQATCVVVRSSNVCNHVRIVSSASNGMLGIRRLAGDGIARVGGLVDDGVLGGLGTVDNLVLGACQRVGGGFVGLVGAGLDAVGCVCHDSHVLEAGCRGGTHVLWGCRLCTQTLSPVA